MTAVLNSGKINSSSNKQQQQQLRHPPRLPSRCACLTAERTIANCKPAKQQKSLVIRPFDPEWLQRHTRNVGQRLSGSAAESVASLTARSAHGTSPPPAQPTNILLPDYISSLNLYRPVPPRRVWQPPPVRELPPPSARYFYPGDGEGPNIPRPSSRHPPRRCSARPKVPHDRA
jgi:hypothetical protein